MRKFIYLSLVLATLFASLAAFAGYAAGHISPEGKEWISFPGLVLLPVLLVNSLFFVGWCMAKSRWAWVSLAALCLNGGFLLSMFQARIFPEEVPAGKQAIKFITYNVDNFNTDGISQFPRISAWLRDEDPDLVCFQEFYAGGDYSMSMIADSLSYLPYSCSSRLVGNMTGLAIFSKYPILYFEVMPYPDSLNGSLFAVLEINGDSVRLFNNHFQTTSVNAVRPRIYEAYADKSPREEVDVAFQLAFQMKRNFVMRAEQVDSVRRMIDESKGPVLVCGDFNDTPASYAYQKIKGNLTDGFREAGAGYGATFRQLKGIFRIDYIFYSPGFKGVSYDSPSLTYSDHNPVVWVGYVSDPF